jgi:hypothetical protein
VFSSIKQGSKYVQNTLLAPQEGLSSNAKKTLSNNDVRKLSSNARGPKTMQKNFNNNNARRIK